MGLWNTFKSSYQSQGIFDPTKNYNPAEYGSFFKPTGEGFLHGIKRGIMDNMFEVGYESKLEGGISYGGSIFSAAGRRQITHDVAESATKGMYKLGARRATRSILWKTAGKLVTPALFLYDASQNGIGEATGNAIGQGIVFGAARWTLNRVAVGLTSPIALGAAAVVGAGIAGAAILKAGRNYGLSQKGVSFGNVFNDVYGTAATMRQQSLMAMQNSKINGRSSLGAEANLMHY